MGGGSGPTGGRSDTQQHAEYPPEFRPLAEAAVSQILGLQGRLPLAEFGIPQEARVAGLSPFTQAGMSLVPSLMSRTAPEQALQQVPTTLGDIMAQFGGVMQPTNPAQAALGFLGGQIGRNAQLFPMAWQPPSMPQIAQGGAAFSGGTPGAGTVFPGVSQPDIPSLMSLSAGGGAPGGGVLTAPPLMPLSTPLPLQTQFDQFAAQQQALMAELAAKQALPQAPALPPGVVLGPSGEIVSNPYGYEPMGGGMFGPPAQYSTSFPSL